MTDSDVTDLGFSLTTPGFFLRPDYHEVLAGLRRRAPVHRTDDGLLAVSRYEDVRTISRDAPNASSAGAAIEMPLKPAVGT